MARRDPTTPQAVTEANPLEVVDEDNDRFLEENDDASPAEVLRISMPRAPPWPLPSASRTSWGRAADLRNLRPADLPRWVHLHLPRALMPAPALVADELTLTDHHTTAPPLLDSGGEAVCTDIAGEKHLWDFPDDCLFHREPAEYPVS